MFKSPAFRSALSICQNPMGFMLREAKEILLLQMLGEHDIEMFSFLFFQILLKFVYVCSHVSIVKRKKGKKVKYGEIEKNQKSQSCPFWACIQETSTSTFGCMVGLLSPSTIYTQ